MKTPFTIGTVGHFGLAVRDPKRSAKWFERALGLKKQFVFEDGVAVGNDNITIALHKGKPSPKTLGHLSFHLPNMAALRKALGHLKKHKVKLEDPGDEIGPEAPGSKHIGLWFYDPDGYRWELSVQKRSEISPEPMAANPPPVRPIALTEIQEAQKRIAPAIVRTPLVRLELGPEYPDIRLKLENLQPINAYKLRGAANAVAMLSEAERKRGVWTISAGNAGQGVAYAARKAGVPCTVVVIETAPESKIARMRALGANLLPVPYEVAWKALDDRSFPGVEGTFIHPFDDHNFIAGHATMGLEILEDAPDTVAVIAGIGGGGLITGVGSAIKALKPEIKVWGAEPETAAPFSLSFAAGSAQKFEDWKLSFVDGAGGQSVFPRMWDRMKPLVDGSIVVTLEETRKAMRLMAEKARIISEGAGALPLAAALTGKAGNGPIVAIVSGGNVDLKKFSELIDL